MKLNIIPKKKLFVKFKQFDAQLFLISNYKAYEVNNMGIEIWKIIDNELTLLDIAKKVSSQFPEEDYEKILTDVCNFIQELIDKELIDIIDIFSRNYQQPLISESKLPSAVIIS